MKKITTFKGIKVGQKFKVVANALGHNYPIGGIYTFKVPGLEQASMTNIAKEIPYGNTIPASCIELVSTSIEDMKEDISRLEAEVKDLKEKIYFCESAGLKEYDDNIVKVLQTMAILKEATSDIEKAKQIAKLIDNN